DPFPRRDPDRTITVGNVRFRSIADIRPLFDALPWKTNILKRTNSRRGSLPPVRRFARVARPRQQRSNGGIAVVSPDWGNGEILVMGFNRSQVFKTLAAIVGVVAIISLALIHFIPAPPSKVVMATAFKGASFDFYGRKYRE